MRLNANVALHSRKEKKTCVKKLSVVVQVLLIREYASTKCDE